jgi:hypothetical protein
MVKIVLNPDNELIANEEDWKRRLQGYEKSTVYLINMIFFLVRDWKKRKLRKRQHLIYFR